MLSWLPILLTALAASGQSGPARVIGRVVDHRSGEGLVGATVRIGSAVHATDRRGFFAASLSGEGVQVFSVEMLGYATRTDSIHVEPGRTYDLDIRLSTQPVKLPPVIATARSNWLELNRFYERKTSGLSPHIITAADMEKRNPTNLTDVLRNVPGMKLVLPGDGRRVMRMNRTSGDADGPVLMRRGTLQGCEPAVFVDGRRYQDLLMPDAVGRTIKDSDFLAPLTIEAIEVYTKTTPQQYSHPCGTVLIWTRRGH